MSVVVPLAPFRRSVLQSTGELAAQHDNRAVQLQTAHLLVVFVHLSGDQLALCAPDVPNTWQRAARRALRAQPWRETTVVDRRKCDDPRQMP